MDTLNTKQCTACGLVKPVSEFHRKRGSYKSECRVCTNARSRAYDHAHRTTRTAQNQEWRHQHREHYNETKREWQHDHADEVNARNTTYRRKNREEINARCAEWHRDNPDKVLALRLKRYGLTVDEYNKMLKKQNYVCAICKNPETNKDPDSGKTRSLAVDHCHATGVIRGLICGRCNLGIGHFKDNPELLRSVIEYLNRSKNTHCAPEEQLYLPGFESK